MEFTVVSHNINSITDIKLQQLWDVAVAMNGAAVTIFCLQETKIPTLSAPTGYTALHSVRKARQGGGIATLVPQALAILKHGLQFSPIWIVYLPWSL